ncbi:MAG: hypothetical protein J6034_01325 [Bacteroidaceae bacterium]|nr:hypothetical protein [Bacteroidaceae bacterium]
MKEISDELYDTLDKLGMLPDEVHSRNVGSSDYSKRFIQPWHIWICYDLNPWDADIVKRVLRNKAGTPREEDYEKIIHISQERIRQINAKKKYGYDK